MDARPERGIAWIGRELPESEVTPEHAQPWVDSLLVLAHVSEEPSALVSRTRGAARSARR